MTVTFYRKTNNKETSPSIASLSHKLELKLVYKTGIL